MKLKMLFLLLLILALGGSAFAQVNNARMLGTPNAVTGTTYTFVAADTTRVTTFSNAGAIAATLPNGATFGFGAGTMLSVVNLGAGTLTITCTGCTISANGVTGPNLAIAAGGGADLYGGIGNPAVNYVALPSPSPGGPGSFTTLSVSGAATLNGGATYSNTTAGADDVKLGIFNRARWNCGTGGYRFGTIESGLADIAANSTQGGFLWTCPDNATDTFTTQNEIGSITKTVALNLHPGNTWTCSITVNSPYCWGIHNASALIGANNGAIGASRTGGAYLKYGCTANTTFGISTAEGLSQIQAYARMEHIFFEGCQTGTVGAGSPSTAMLNIEGISSLNTWDHNYVFQFANTVGIRLASNNAGGNNALLGPLVMVDNWSLGNNNTGAQPWKITTTPGSCAAILPISIHGGVGHGSGSSLPEFEINGQGASCSSRLIQGGLISGFYTENTNGGLTPIHFKIVDANNFKFQSTSSHVATAGETLLDISQSAVGFTCNITAENNYVSNNSATAVNNHISGFSLTGQGYLPFYHYGGDSSCPIYPLIIDSNQLQIVKKNNALLLQNLLDAQMNMDLNSGLTASQNAFIRFFNHTVSDATPQVLFGMSGGGTSLRIVNSAFSQVSLNADVAGQFQANSWGAGNGIRLNMSNNSNSNIGTQFGSGGATAIEVGRFDSSGNIFFHCQTTTFQNCGELTGVFTGGASPRIITAPDAASVTPSFLNCGTTSTCAQTNATRLIVLNGGPIALAAGTLTITSLPFTSSTSYVCSTDDGTASNTLQVTYNSGSSVTFSNGALTDTIRYTCTGN